MKHSIDDGQIIFVSSYAGHKVWNVPAGRFYSATKHAVKALLEGWREEVSLSVARIISVPKTGIAH